MDVITLEALADERRLAIVELLADGEKCLCDVSDALDISSALASHHVKKLRAAGLVLTDRRGAWLHCRLDPDKLAGLASSLNALANRSSESVAGPCCTAKEWEADE
ncbi:MAG: metalloregulator ArsR/SmtB family transcription factor [Coriobacteriia bacterium]|nr:metalloregulator ArsR/SmtB family transcription factor [Coriobacteriia bacterium]